MTPTSLDTPARERPAMPAARPLGSWKPYWARRFGPAPFLPMSRAEMDVLGWDSCDIVIVTGDAYVDHPSFGMAVIGRVLEAQGFRVGIIAQPDWHSAEPFRALGRPNLFFGVAAGNMDSMINHYTADRKIRSDDASAASRPACAASRTTTTGRTRCGARSSSTARPTCSSTAMPSARSSRSRTASRAASRSRR